MKKIFLAAAVAAIGLGSAQAFELNGISAGNLPDTGTQAEIALPAPVRVAAPRRGAGNASGVYAELSAAVSAAQDDETRNSGYYVELKAYAPGTALARIYADVVNVTQEEMAEYQGYFSETSGAAAAAGFSREMLQEAKEVAETEEETDLAIAGKLKAVSAAAKKTFASGQGFQELTFAKHDRVEDGDMDYKILVARDAAGGLVALSYLHNPY